MTDFLVIKIALSIFTMFLITVSGIVFACRILIKRSSHSKLRRCMCIVLYFSTIFAKGNNFCDTLFTFLDIIAIPKWGLL